MAVRAFTILYALAAVVPTVSARGAIVGPAVAIDGDTLQVDGQKIRLYGVDAPEVAQTCVARREWRCGIEAMHALAQKIASGTVDCAERGRAGDDTLLATCRLGAEDLAAWLVEKGWALAWRAQSSDYLVEEQNARVARRGIWRGTILPPWDWRAAAIARARAKGGTQNGAQNESVMLAALPANADNNTAARTFTIRAASNGHFHVEAVANGRRLPLVVDTGASLVALSRQDAERIGLDMSRLSYTQRIHTANGVARVAPVKLLQLSVGPITVTDVEAVVIEGRSEYSLLGMSFLSRLDGYSVSGGTLTMTGP